MANIGKNRHVRCNTADTDMFLWASSDFNHNTASLHRKNSTKRLSTSNIDWSFRLDLDLVAFFLPTCRDSIKRNMAVRAAGYLNFTA